MGLSTLVLAILIGYKMGRFEVTVLHEVLQDIVQIQKFFEF